MHTHNMSVRHFSYVFVVLVLVQVRSWTSLVQHHFGSVSEHFLDQTRNMCSICFLVFVYFI